MPDLPEARIRPFSLRHRQAIENRSFDTDIPDRLRNRLWSTATLWNEPIYYSTADNPGWTHNSCVINEAAGEYARLLGVARTDLHGQSQALDLQHIFRHGMGYDVFDVLEIMHALMPDGSRDFQRSINDAFVDFACPWRLADGMFFRMDSAFLEEEVLGKATDLLGSPELAGAHDEFQRARDYLTDGSSRDAIVYASHSVESTLKAVTGKSGTIDALAHGFVAYGMDDLPAEKAKAAARALRAVSTLRNELGGHGQGSDVLTVPRPYAELAVHLAAAINHFILTQHTSRKPREASPVEEMSAGYQGYQRSSKPADDDEIPF